MNLNWCETERAYNFMAILFLSFFRLHKIWCWQEEEEYTKTCRGRNSVAILKEYFQSMLMDVTKYARNIDQVPRRRRRRRFMRLACWLEEVHLLQQRTSKRKVLPLLVSTENLLYTIIILCMDLGFEEMAHLGSIGVWAYYKKAKTWVEDMIGLSFRNLLEFGVPTCLGAGEGAVDWVVGTYWKDRRTLFFPLKKGKNLSD